MSPTNEVKIMALLIISFPEPVTNNRAIPGQSTFQGVAIKNSGVTRASHIAKAEYPTI